MQQNQNALNPKTPSVKRMHTFVDILCRTGASIRGVEVVRAAGTGQRAGVTTWRGLCVRVTCVPTVAVVMWREGGATAIYYIHGLWGQSAEEEVVRGHALTYMDPKMAERWCLAFIERTVTQKVTFNHPQCVLEKTHVNYWSVPVQPAEQLPAHSLDDAALEHQLKCPKSKNDGNWKASGVFVCLKGNWRSKHHTRW